MTVDETRWPGPSWDFTIHEGFPPHPVDGDLYLSIFGLKYLCVRGRYKPLSDAEWDDLLGIRPEVKPAASGYFRFPGRRAEVYKYKEDEMVLSKTGESWRIGRQEDGKLIAIGIGISNLGTYIEELDRNQSIFNVPGFSGPIIVKAGQHVTYMEMEWVCVQRVGADDLWLQPLNPSCNAIRGEFLV